MFKLPFQKLNLLEVCILRSSDLEDFAIAAML
jgi:hypothetical protein